ncbi:cytochrome ubiquinol oxidase subunit I, partial [Arthrobacter deserti]|nr:cytochrome ubiquinol oxidase subunit I [Arthrobacter deserti]
AMHQFSTIASFVLGASLIPFWWNVYVTWRNAKKVEVDDPWGFGGSLVWATSCPPPRHNFTSLPRIRSERPALDLHHPELAPRRHQTQEEEDAALSPAGKVLGPADRTDDPGRPGTG